MLVRELEWHVPSVHFQWFLSQRIIEILQYLDIFVKWTNLVCSRSGRKSIKAPTVAPMVGAIFILRRRVPRTLTARALDKAMDYTVSLQEEAEQVA